MNIPQLRKALKGASIEIIIERERNIPDIMSLALNVFVATPEQSKVCLIGAKAQGNDQRHPNAVRDRPDRSVLGLTGLSGFYACRVEARYDLGDSFALFYENPVRVSNFVKLVKPIMAKYNQHYPDCEVSRLILALNELGASWNATTVEGKPPADWNIKRSRSY